MSDFSIRAVNVCKGYKQYANNKERLLEWLLPGRLERHKTKWVLKDISFEIKQGESVGIVGMNGAGKSTLLKIITGTTVPTKGHVMFNGRIAALLELGMGFHPDFTGRQNVIMSGQLLGFTVAEIEEKMPEIEAFAEIGAAIDEVVRTYSSGMQVRLAFSAATMVRPDILIVDEALSVGDAYFQHKSFDRIKKFREQGTTLLLVSHDKAAIQAICDRAILLNKGVVEKAGNPEMVMNYYNALLAERKNQHIEEFAADDGKNELVSGTGEAVTEQVFLRNQQGEMLEAADVGQSVELVVDVLVQKAIAQLVIGIMIKDVHGQDIYGTNTFLKGKSISDLAAGQRLRSVFRFPMNIGVGKYSVTTALTSTDTHLVDNYEWRDLAYAFEVINVDKDKFLGAVWLEPEIDLTVVGGGK